MAERSRVLAASPEDPGSDPVTDMTAQNCLELQL